jgi:K+-sensing histidine kinase KdpD
MSLLHSHDRPQSTISFVRHWASPLTMSLAVVALTTLLVWTILPRLQHQHLIFIYFIPTAFIAIRYGSISAIGVTIASTLVAAYFIYPPRFSFVIADRLEVTELILFCLLALLASQVVSGFAKDPKTVKRAPRTRRASVAANWRGLRPLLSRLRDKFAIY